MRPQQTIINGFVHNRTIPHKNNAQYLLFRTFGDDLLDIVGFHCEIYHSVHHFRCYLLLERPSVTSLCMDFSGAAVHVNAHAPLPQFNQK